MQLLHLLLPLLQVWHLLPPLLQLLCSQLLHLPLQLLQPLLLPGMVLLQDGVS
jgi:hypothetical protein